MLFGRSSLGGGCAELLVFSNTGGTGLVGAGVNRSADPLCKSCVSTQDFHRFCSPRRRAFEGDDGLPDQSHSTQSVEGLLSEVKITRGVVVCVVCEIEQRRESIKQGGRVSYDFMADPSDVPNNYILS